MQTLLSPRDVIPFQKPQDSVFSMLITRKISRVITFYLLRFFPRVTPNQVSVSSFVLCCIAVWCFIMPSYAIQFLGVLLLQLSFAVDCSDGEVSRITNQASKFGAWLDSTLDRFKEALMLGSMTWYAYEHIWNDVRMVLIGVVAIVGMLMVSYLREAKKSSWPTQRTSELYITKNIYIGTVDVTIYLVSFAVLVHGHVYALALFALVSIPLMLKQIWSAYRLK
ncbi:MAG: CDP-alcohol phosphatidyltransferase family protein [Candidatus Kerfeldbacteria bacterium]|nr:CDP-alcohol phosphatidyltransferase family protein [Candidatus Kerfeldbacteria bacterium]